MRADQAPPAVDNDVHVRALAHADGDDDRRDFIYDHYSSSFAASSTASALLRAQLRGDARLYAVLGGQGNNANYFDELRSLYRAYGPLVRDLVEPASALLAGLARDGRVADQYPAGLDVSAWLADEAATPPADVLVAAPISFPVIGLLQLAQFKAVCVGLGCSPADVPRLFAGLAGHSQGLVVPPPWPRPPPPGPSSTTRPPRPCACSSGSAPAASRPSPRRRSRATRAQQLEADGLGAPTPMLSVRNMPRDALERCIAAVNGYLPSDADARPGPR